MGARKRNTAEAIKESKKSQYFAKLNNCPTSPRKMRLVADLVRGMEVYKALGVLQFSNKEAASKVVKLLKSAIHNYEAKTGEAPESGELFVSKIAVDSARMLKRIQPAPQGRAHRIRKRSNHVTLFLEKVN
ncbi:MAG: 50S ribosomal protein L22 [Flavobacteriales bacterium]|nr:50S ribosomal protein L22 [Flavobacteriales bacterium]|tara:strand:+ start:1834 stop:2226 length:393 start_codon:yes stop_codon:yes gene_type:complete